MPSVSVHRFPKKASRCRLHVAARAAATALVAIAVTLAAASGSLADDSNREPAADDEWAEPAELRPGAPLGDAERKKLLTRLATRSSLRPQGTIRFAMKYVWGRQPPLSAEFLFAASGESWILRPSVAAPHSVHTGAFTLVHHKRCLEGIQTIALGTDSGRTQTSSVGGGVPRILEGTQLEIKYPESVAAVRERVTPCGMGTLYYASGREYVSGHLLRARLPGLTRLFGLDVRVVEWDVSPDDAAAAFPMRNRFLAMGGLLRVYLAPSEDDAVVRIEGIDRFGTRQVRVDCRGFDGPAAGTHFPRFGSIEDGSGVSSFEVTGLAPPPPLAEFELDIPSAIRVVDRRPKEVDQFNDPGANNPMPQFAGGVGFFPGGFGGAPMAGPGGMAVQQQAVPTFQANLEEYPLHLFMTTARYSRGFPKKLLAELDRDVLPWERGETWTLVDPSQPGMFPPTFGQPASVAARLNVSQNYAHMAAQAAAATGMPAGQPANMTPASLLPQANAAPTPKQSLRYAGKSFDEWRQVLLTDLEPETRVKALAALGVFAANGYAAESAAAIDEVLKALDPQTGVQVIVAALMALPHCGAAAVPVLESQLDRDIPAARQQVVTSIANLAPSTDKVVPALLKIAQDPAINWRAVACGALASHQLTAPGVEAVIVRGLADEPAVRVAIVRGLGDSSAPAAALTKLLAAALADENPIVCVEAVASFSSRAVASAENARVLQQAVLAFGLRERQSIVANLQRKRQQHAPLVAGLVVPVLAELLESADSYTPPGQASQFSIPVASIALLGELARGDTVKSALPPLIDAVNLQLPTGTDASDIRLQIEAADALGRIGPAARDARPILERWLDSPVELTPAQLQPAGIASPKQWRARLEAAVKKIEAK